MDGNGNRIARFDKHEQEIAEAWTRQYNGEAIVFSAGPACVRKRDGRWVVLDGGGTVVGLYGAEKADHDEALRLATAFNRADMAVTARLGEVDWTKEMAPYDGIRWYDWRQRHGIERSAERQAVDGGAQGARGEDAR